MVSRVSDTNRCRTSVPEALQEAPASSVPRLHIAGGGGAHAQWKLKDPVGETSIGKRVLQIADDAQER